MIGDSGDGLPYTFLFCLGKRVLGPYFLSRFSLEKSGDFPAPPFLLVANHLSALDPFFVSALSPYPIAWVANRLIFQHPILGPLIRSVGAIPKTKGLPDYSTIQGIFRVLERGGVVGLFPEGTVTPDGVSQDVAPGTEKLLSRIGVPVVFAHIQGAWMRKPLWAKHARHGPVRVDFVPLLNLSLFFHSEWEWQRTHAIPFRGNARAEGIERVVFFCPACQGFRTIFGQGRKIVCHRCQASWTIDELGFIDGKTQREFAGNQDALLAAFLETCGTIPLGKAWVSERAYPQGTLKKVYYASIIVEGEGLRLGETFLPFSGFQGTNTFLSKIFEFTFKKTTFRIHTSHNALLLLAIVKLKKGQREKHRIDPEKSSPL